MRPSFATWLYHKISAERFVGFFSILVITEIFLSSKDQRSRREEQ